CGILHDIFVARERASCWSAQLRLAPTRCSMNKVTPRDFRNAFLAVMESERDSFRTAVGFETKSYNYFMRSTIYPRIARNLGLLSWNKEYYTLDGMFYEERGVDDTGKYATYANWISVAIEHKNDASSA